MLWIKIKKTLTISSDFKKKLDTSSISSGGKILIEKKNRQGLINNLSDQILQILIHSK